MRRSHIENRFDNYRGMSAKRNGPADCREGHSFKRGERIGWHPGLRLVYCADCWRAWVEENREADYLERSSSY